MVIQGKEKRIDLFQDLSIMIIVVVVGFVLAVIFDLVEWMTRWLDKIDKYEVDGFIIIIPAALVMYLWYQARRMRFMKSVIDQAKNEEKELTDRISQLEKELRETELKLEKEKAVNYQVSRYEELLQPSSPNLKNQLPK